MLRAVRASFATVRCGSLFAALVMTLSCHASSVKIHAAPQPIAHAALTPPASPTARAVVEPRGDEATSESLPTGDDELVRGRSTILVHAPVTKVRSVVLDFDTYAQFMPHYTASRVLAKRPDGSREVYMQVAALRGLVKMGARVVFPTAAREEAGFETYESQFLDGNVDEFKAIWRMKPVDAMRSLVSLEVFLLPRLPLPKSVMNDENTTGAVKGVTAMKARIESR